MLHVYTDPSRSSGSSAHCPLLHSVDDGTPYAAAKAAAPLLRQEQLAEGAYLIVVADSYGVRAGEAQSVWRFHVEREGPVPPLVIRGAP